MNKEKYGIIDIGSNTMRLVIYFREKSGRLKEIENVKVVARLRNFLSDQGDLSEDGIRVLVETLLSFREVTLHHSLEEVKCVATATIRQAKNQQVILDRVKKSTDFTIRILSEYEEAYFGYLAVVNTTPYKSGITIDIGGGSTEVTYFHERNLVQFHSFPFGALSLKKQFIAGDIPSETELKALRKFILEQFSQLDWIKDKKLPIIGIGGSARNMVQIHQEYVSYPIAGVHQYIMSREDVSVMNQYLQSLTFSELQKVEGLSKDRADIIIPAVEVFRQLVSIVDASHFALSRKGLRDGVFFEELTKEFGISVFPNVVEESFYELATDYNINLNHVFHVTNGAVIITELLNKAGVISTTKKDELFLKRGAFVYNLGSYIDSESSSQHTFYLLANRTIDGLFHKERMIVALIASYTSKSGFKRYVTPYSQWFSKEEIHTYRLLGAILKFAYSLNATKRNIIKSIDLCMDEEGLTFLITCHHDWKPEQYQAEKSKKHLEKLLKRPISILFSEEKSA